MWFEIMDSNFEESLSQFPLKTLVSPMTTELLSVEVASQTFGQMQSSPAALSDS
jgi:hypothetical protein